MIEIIKAKDFDIRLFRKHGEQTHDVSAAVREIISGVQSRGDAAMFEYSRKFDGAELSSLEVTADEWDEAVNKVEPEIMKVLEKAAENITAFHSNQKRSGFITNGSGGTVSGQKITPIERVGLYIPGGTAAYPSCALMIAIPAKIAGVRRLVMTTPPGKDGGIKNPYILAAAKIAGVDRVFKAGGAQAVAALAYGTESIPRVDKIVGPGNAYVAEAKKQVFGVVGIDMVAGPSDVCIIADDSADAVFVAADLLAQAEHDVNARAVLITDSKRLAGETEEEIERQLQDLPRREIAEKSIENNGVIILCENIEDGVSITNEIAPEHLEIYTKDAFGWLADIKNAGSVFLGGNTPEALGDYLAGANNTLPTLGTARFSSPVSVDDFVKKTQFTYYTREALEKVAGDVAAFAEIEGLKGHALSVTRRMEKKS